MIDWYAQVVLLGNAGGAYVLLNLLTDSVRTSTITVLLFVPFGAWQVVGAVVNALYGSTLHIKYLGFVVASLVFAGLGVSTGEGLIHPPVFLRVIGMVFLFVVPLFMGIWAFAIAHQNMLLVKDEGAALSNRTLHEMEDILDSDMLDNR